MYRPAWSRRGNSEGSSRCQQRRSWHGGGFHHPPRNRLRFSSSHSQVLLPWWVDGEGERSCEIEGSRTPGTCLSWDYIKSPCNQFCSCRQTWAVSFGTLLLIHRFNYGDIVECEGGSSSPHHHAISKQRQTYMQNPRGDVASATPYPPKIAIQMLTQIHQRHAITSIYDSRNPTNAHISRTIAITAPPTHCTYNHPINHKSSSSLSCTSSSACFLFSSSISRYVAQLNNKNAKIISNPPTIAAAVSGEYSGGGSI